MRKTCSRCSSTFVCREDRTDVCHCTRIYLVSGVREYLSDNYSGCLCHQCLKETNDNFLGFGINPKYSVKR